METQKRMTKAAFRSLSKVVLKKLVEAQEIEAIEISMDGSGELGGFIADQCQSHTREHIFNWIKEQGYDPEEYMIWLEWFVDQGEKYHHVMGVWHEIFCELLEPEQE